MNFSLFCCFLILGGLVISRERRWQGCNIMREISRGDLG